MADCEDISLDEIIYTSPVSLSRKDFAIVQKQLLTVIKDISDRVRTSEAEIVAAWNIDWFEVRK